MATPKCPSSSNNTQSTALSLPFGWTFCFRAFRLDKLKSSQIPHSQIQSPQLSTSLHSHPFVTVDKPVLVPRGNGWHQHLCVIHCMFEQVRNMKQLHSDPPNSTLTTLCTAMAWLYSTCPLQTGFYHLAMCMEISFLVWVTSTVWGPLLACVNAKRHLGTFQVLSVTKEAVENIHWQVWGIWVPCGIKLRGGGVAGEELPLTSGRAIFHSSSVLDVSHPRQHLVASASGFGACM